MIALTASAIRVPKLNKKRRSGQNQNALGESPGLLAAAVPAAVGEGQIRRGISNRAFFTGLFPAALFYFDNKPPVMRNRPGL